MIGSDGRPYNIGQVLNRQTYESEASELRPIESNEHLCGLSVPSSCSTMYIRYWAAETETIDANITSLPLLQV